MRYAVAVWLIAAAGLFAYLTMSGAMSWGSIPAPIGLALCALYFASPLGAVGIVIAWLVSRTRARGRRVGL